MNVTLLRITLTIPIPMMNERRYPVGIQTFSEIINGGYVYVDKTDLMWQMQRLSKYIFLSRPRRFGKSLLSTTLCSFFEGRKDLFKGLKVMELEREWQSYPVIHLDLSMAKNMDSPEALRARLMLMLDNYAALYGSKESEVTPGGLFQGLMPVVGFFLGSQFQHLIESVDHWIAFGLLFLIGANMIREAVWGSEDHQHSGSLDAKTMFLLAVATSIDALAVGVSFACIQVELWSSVLVIGITTFLFSVLGVKIGNVFGSKFEKSAGIFGGIILILIGLKILLEHLGILSF